MAKKALCVGINDYPGTNSDLGGCVNDAKDWKAALESRGYDVALALDSDATRDNMVEELTRLVQDSRAGDSLVFTYSGHGSWLADTDGDEVDGRDEMLCPHDIAAENYLLDDDLAEIFGNKPRGVRLFFVSDSCHSGTVARFAPPLFPAEAATHPKPRFLPPLAFLSDSRAIARARQAARIPRNVRQKYPALLAAACQDTELSWDASFNGRANGAFTFFALRALEGNPTTPSKWYEKIRDFLPTGTYPQRPRLYGSSVAKSGAMF